MKGIYLRNLTFTRPRGRTIDDSAIQPLPKRDDGLDAAPQLHHAASSESLRKLRRRSTIGTSAGFTPQVRQEKLEQSIETKVADVFVSIYADSTEEPIYLSETIARATVSALSLTFQSRTFMKSALGSDSFLHDA